MTKTGKLIIGGTFALLVLCIVSLASAFSTDNTEGIDLLSSPPRQILYVEIGRMADGSKVYLDINNMVGTKVVYRVEYASGDILTYSAAFNFSNDTVIKWSRYDNIGKTIIPKMAYTQQIKGYDPAFIVAQELRNRSYNGNSLFADIAKRPRNYMD